MSAAAQADEGGKEGQGSTACVRYTCARGGGGFSCNARICGMLKGERGRGQMRMEWVVVGVMGGLSRGRCSHRTGIVTSPGQLCDDA